MTQPARRFPTPPRRSRRTNAALGVGFAAWFVFCALLSLGLLGVLVWALIELVQWVTSK